MHTSGRAITAVVGTAGASGQANCCSSSVVAPAACTAQPQVQAVPVAVQGLSLVPEPGLPFVMSTENSDTNQARKKVNKELNDSQEELY